MLNHLEYDAHTLASEYFRDADAGLNTALPVNYFPGDDTASSSGEQLAALCPFVDGKLAE